MVSLENSFMDQVYRMRFALTAFFVLCLFAPAAQAQYREIPAQQALKDAITPATADFQTLPDLQFSTPEGVQVEWLDIAADIVVLNIWATWCAPCVEELPSLAGLQAKFNPEKLRVVPISIDDDFSAKKRDTFLRRIGGLDLPLYWDSYDTIGTALNISGVPTTLVINRDKKILAVYEGDTRWDDPKIIAFFKSVLPK